VTPDFDRPIGALAGYSPTEYDAGAPLALPVLGENGRPPARHWQSQWRPTSGARRRRRAALDCQFQPEFRTKTRLFEGRVLAFDDADEGEADFAGEFGGEPGRDDAVRRAFINGGLKRVDDRRGVHDCVHELMGGQPIAVVFDDSFDERVKPMARGRRLRTIVLGHVQPLLEID